MAVVKANYVKRGIGEKGRAKATVKYIETRPGRQKEKLARTIFTSDGSITRQQVYKMIDEAQKDTFFYRLVISPDPSKEDFLRDLNLTELTVQAIADLEMRLKTAIQFAAVIHDDHAPHRHVHVLAILDRKLRKTDINSLRSKATALARFQKRILEIKHERSRSTNHKLTTRLKQGRGAAVSYKDKTSYAPAPTRSRQACPCCGEGYSTPMRKIAENLHKCTSCGIILRQTGIGTEVERSAGWGLSY